MATTVFPYLHVLDGRLRIKIPQVKGAAQRARAVEHLLLGLPGVTAATANPITGNVLVLFTPKVTDQHDIITTLQQVGYLREEHRTPESDCNSLAAIVMQSAVELALQRLVTAII